MIHPRKVRDLQKRIEGRITVLDELADLGQDVPSGVEELQQVREWIIKLHSETTKTG